MNVCNRIRLTMLVTIFCFLFCIHRTSKAAEISEQKSIKEEEQSLIDLKKAAVSGNRREIYALYQKKIATINAVDATGNIVRTSLAETIGEHPLSLAAAYGDKEIIETLLECNFHLHERDKSGNLAVSWAVYSGHDELLEWLVHKGASLDVIINGQSLLNLAVQNRRVKSVLLILSYRAQRQPGLNFSFSRLTWAAYKGYTNVILFLMRRKESPINVDERDGWHNTALLWATRNKNMVLINLLLESGASIHAPNRDGETPFSCAVEHDYSSIVLAMTTHQAQKENTNKKGLTTLMWAVRSGYGDAVSILLAIKECVTTINDVDSDGNSALHWATERGDNEIVKKLCDNGADISCQNKRGWTPISVAIRNNKLETTEYLFDNYGEEVDINPFQEKNEYGYNPFIQAARYGNTELLLLMLKQGASVDELDDADSTALYWAARFGKHDAVAVLLEHGAHVNHENRYGWTPLYWAARNHHAKVVRLLIEEGAHINNDLDYGWIVPYCTWTQSVKTLFKLSNS